jgi:hypothetical protein
VSVAGFRRALAGGWLLPDRRTATIDGSREVAIDRVELAFETSRHVARGALEDVLCALPLESPVLLNELTSQPHHCR